MPLERDAHRVISHGRTAYISSRGAGSERARRRCAAFARAVVITRIDDPNWAERTGESYSTLEAASEAGWIALDRIRAVKKLDRS
jgi:hypothetical protein